MSCPWIKSLRTVAFLSLTVKLQKRQSFQQLEPIYVVLRNEHKEIYMSNIICLNNIDNN